VRAWQLYFSFGALRSKDFIELQANKLAYNLCLQK